jgi:hypothetical protein
MAARTKRGSKTSRKRKGGRARPRARKSPSRRERLEAARPISLEDWLDEVRRRDAAATEAKAAPVRGACLVKDPRTGQSLCIRTTPDACRSLKGTWLGGPCGS